MKKLIFITYLLIASSVLMAQKASEEEKNVSNAELFARQSGTLIKSEFLQLGTVKNNSFEVVKYTDLLTGEESKALRFEYVVVVGVSTDSRASVLDQDEVEALSKSLDLIKNQVMSESASVYTEVNFTSRSGFQAGCFWNKGEWTPFIKGKRYESNSMISLKEKHLNELIDIIDSSLNKF